MTNRIVEIAETGAFVHLTNNLIEIRYGEPKSYTLPVEEVGVLLLSNPAVTITQSAIVSIIESGGMVVFCGKNYLPAGMFLPIGAHSSAARNFELQIKASNPLKKQIWKEIVRKKVLFQSQLLQFLYGEDGGLQYLVNTVKSGDSTNVEGKAAKYYWKKLFSSDFKRNPDRQDQNKFLNYGYTVLKACTARAICSAGLHPSFGIHHHNQYDAFRLAHDIMEPFRPMVDKKVIEVVHQVGCNGEMNKEVKKKLLEILSESIILEKKHTSVFEGLTRCASSILQSFEEGKNRIILPDLLIVK